MVKRGPEILPEGRPSSWVVRRKQQTEHIDESADARGANDYTQNQRQTDRQLPVGYEKRNRGRVRQYKPLKDRDHNRDGISSRHAPQPQPSIQAPTDGLNTAFADTDFWHKS